MELDRDHIRITRRGQIAGLPLQALTSATALRKGMLGTALTISSQERADVTLKAASHVAAAGFADQLKDAWTRFNLAALEQEAARLDRLLVGVLGLAAPPKFPSPSSIRTTSGYHAVTAAVPPCCTSPWTAASSTSRK